MLQAELLAASLNKQRVDKRSNNLPINSVNFAFEVLSPVTMSGIMFLDVTPYSWVEFHQSLS
jgi:hypothetical protein